MATRQEDTPFHVMCLLQANPDLTQRELAEQLGVSVSGLNNCLKALMEKGWVKMHNFSQSKNKFGYVYILTPTGMAGGTVLGRGAWMQAGAALGYGVKVSSGVTLAPGEAMSDITTS